MTYLPVSPEIESRLPTCAQTRLLRIEQRRTALALEARKAMLKPEPDLAICARCDRAEPVRTAEFSESLAHDRQGSSPNPRAANPNPIMFCKACTMHLFTPLKIRDVTFRNRIVVSPMCQYSSTDGFANEWHLVHLGTRALGGAGLVFTEASAVTPEGRITPDDLGIWKDEHIDFLARIARFIEQQGAVAGMQLAHAGRKASTAAPWLGGHPVSEAERGWRPIFAPSAIPFSDKHQVPQALDEAGIRAIVRAFGEAAGRALKAGFRVLEIHSAHGYLLHSFLSPPSNHRQDAYGGSFENRTRILCEVVREIRSQWPEWYPLFLRISATDYAEGGWDIEQSVELVRQAKLLGVDLVDCSSGGLLPGVAVPFGPGYQTAFAERIKKEAGILTGAVGMITAAEQAEHVLRTGQADVVVMARELLRHPYWPLEAARKLGAEAPWPNQYLRAKQ